LDRRNYSYELIIEKYRSKAKTKKNVLKHTTLYIHCIDLLMRSAKKLDFPFYDFSVIYYNFSKIQPKQQQQQAFCPKQVGVG
jgi:hypothetical protein